jgi:hypothetical protein
MFRFIGICLYIVQTSSQLYTSLINPGIPHRNNYLSEAVMETMYKNHRLNNVKFDKYRLCRNCNILVNLEQNITHCEDCNICVAGIFNYKCIIDLDHHCVWIGKCIAKNNLMGFNVFLVTTLIFGVYSIFALLLLLF